MGQLERYGLYVLVVVIALILGVSIFGDDPKEQSRMNEAIASQRDSSLEGPRNNSNLFRLGQGVDGPFTDVPKPNDGPGPGAGGLGSLFDDPAVIGGPVVDGPISDGPSNDGPNTDQPKPDPLPEPQPQPEPAPQTKTIHKVRRGDNAYRIAQRYYGTQGASAIRAIKDANPGVNWTRLQENQEINVPAYESRAKASIANSNQPLNADTVIRHKIRKGDSIYSLAQKYLGSPSTSNQNAIRMLNPQVKNDRILVGKTLAIPRRNP